MSAVPGLAAWELSAQLRKPPSGNQHAPSPLQGVPGGDISSRPLLTAWLNPATRCRPIRLLGLETPSWLCRTSSSPWVTDTLVGSHTSPCGLESEGSPRAEEEELNQPREKWEMMTGALAAS